jgi:hypothetical protein
LKKINQKGDLRMKNDNQFKQVFVLALAFAMVMGTTSAWAAKPVDMAPRGADHAAAKAIEVRNAEPGKSMEEHPSGSIGEENALSRVTANNVDHPNDGLARAIANHTPEAPAPAPAE